MDFIINPNEKEHQPNLKNKYTTINDKVYILQPLATLTIPDEEITIDLSFKRLRKEFLNFFGGILFIITIEILGVMLYIIWETLR